MSIAAKQGESLHDLGREGARRAKQWLESTSRVDACWVNPDKGAVEKLTFEWPQDGQSFSFDLGGKLRYGAFDGKLFYAEVKKYSKALDLGTHYKDFLAKCYVAYLGAPRFADNFMWVSWAPHAATSWDELTTAAKVRESVVANAHRIFPPAAKVDALVDDDTCAAVAERLWILILSDKQEDLVPAVEHLGLIHQHEMLKAAGR
ncbi:hypothetical protein [Brachybacterium sp. J153]|uniref:hypothetical protein n=1 Tax=Brachybacterium sp. J153 TaxID=3116488 RepID=UPI002E76A347|nr:hypothetical protein [Brachybacterium sp. J153]MEE1619268.1 hypothetical protein [Brachybacterium sp. J153]